MAEQCRAGIEWKAALRRCLNSMPGSNAQLDVEKDANGFSEIAVVREGFRRRNQHARVAELPQQSRYTPQHCGVVIDDKDDFSVWHGNWRRGQARQR